MDSAVHLLRTKYLHLKQRTDGLKEESSKILCSAGKNILLTEVSLTPLHRVVKVHSYYYVFLTANLRIEEDHIITCTEAKTPQNVHYLDSLPSILNSN